MCAKEVKVGGVVSVEGNAGINTVTESGLTISDWFIQSADETFIVYVPLAQYSGIGICQVGEYGGVGPR